MTVAHVFKTRSFLPYIFCLGFSYLPIITHDMLPMGFLRRRGPSEFDAVTRGPSESENYIGGATLDRGFADEQRTSLPLLDLRRPYRRSSARAPNVPTKTARVRPKKRATYQLQPSASGHESLSFALNHFEVTCIKGAVKFAFATNSIRDRRPL